VGGVSKAAASRRTPKKAYCAGLGALESGAGYFHKLDEIYA